MDAGPVGVAENPIVMTGDCYAHVMRKDGLTAQEQAAVVAADRKFVGYRYAWFDATTLPLPRRAATTRHTLAAMRVAPSLTLQQGYFTSSSMIIAGHGARRSTAEIKMQ